MNENSPSAEPEPERDEHTDGGRDAPLEDQANGQCDQRQTDAQQDAEIQRLKDRASRRESVLYMLAVFGFAVALVSGVTSMLQWQVMREQARDARTAMSLEYRAWLLSNGASAVTQTHEGREYFSVRIPISNYGKTPATSITSIGHTRSFKPSAQNLGWMHGFKPIPRHPEPQWHNGEIEADLSELPQVNERFSVLPPMGSGVVEIDIPRPVKEMTARNDVLAVYGQIQYSDAMGGARCVGFCYFTNTGGTFTACGSNNRDEEPEEPRGIYRVKSIDQMWVPGDGRPATTGTAK